MICSFISNGCDFSTNGFPLPPFFASAAICRTLCSPTIFIDSSDVQYIIILQFCWFLGVPASHKTCSHFFRQLSLSSASPLHWLAQNGSCVVQNVLYSLLYK